MSLSDRFRDAGMRLSMSNVNAFGTYINSKNAAQETAMAVPEAELNALISKCIRLAN